ncbi:hypothetical protein GCM10009733_048590 [Nonomuraea maheshkhaliensis]|uniref:Uncharacterized protein n=1 Tax=Nonomuraea maheshkhaliensis TaxID=419590 RepID=A0ABN2FHA1_9ACTN
MSFTESFTEPDPTGAGPVIRLEDAGGLGAFGVVPDVVHEVLRGVPAYVAQGRGSVQEGPDERSPGREAPGRPFPSATQPWNFARS